MSTRRETNWDVVLPREELADIAVQKNKEYIEISIPNSEVETYLKQGYEIKKELKTKTTVYKTKKVGDSFEDEVWSIFYKMGFKYMNKDNSFHILYSPENALTKQIDVLAIDDEICLLIECKEASTYDTSKNFQKDINEIGSLRKKLFNAVREKFPGVKFKYVFATKNCVVGDKDKDRLKEEGIIYFDYPTILYYKALVGYLGSAAKYQLLGQIFKGEEVSSLDMEVPAIRGKMGGLTYYSFLVQPEKLLKIAYVLHKTNANNDYDDMLPSYQRLIKKDRLESVRQFVNEGNFFPNCLVISVDTKGHRPLKFEQVKAKYNKDNLAQMGMLYLPPVYQSAYIIDGQHRLYGYSDSKYVDNNSIPVVAFENLDKIEQLKLFMEINLNQKAVPKALRNILEIDIYYDSPDPVAAQSALLGKLAKSLGENPNSPLKGRVVIGEDAETKRCCITIENIKLALQKTGFFNKLKKNGEITIKGILDKNSNIQTFPVIYKLLEQFFNGIQNEFLTEWNNDDGLLVKNNFIGPAIRILGDIVQIQYEKDNSIVENFNDLWEACQEHVELFLLVIGTLTAEERDKILKERGASAPNNVHRTLQMKMFENDSTFVNKDIETYYEEQYKNYNEEAKPKIVEIRKAILEYMKTMFSTDDWMRRYLSEQHENELTSRVLAKNNSFARNGSEQKVTVWEELTFQDINKIISHGSNWSSYFKDKFNEWNKDYTKNDIQDIISTLNSCSQRVKNGQKINGADYNQINKLYSAIVKEGVLV